MTGGELLVAGAESRDRQRGGRPPPLGIGYISEDRKQEGLILTHSVLENAGITVWRKSRSARRSSRDGTIRSRRCAGHSPSSTCARRRSRKSSPIFPAATSRRSASPNGWRPACRILIVDEPTVGIDIKTKAYIHELLRQTCRRGDRDPADHQRHARDDHARRSDRVMDGYRIKGEIANDRDYGRISREIMGLIHI